MAAIDEVDPVAAVAAAAAADDDDDDDCCVELIDAARSFKNVISLLQTSCEWLLGEWHKL